MQSPLGSNCHRLSCGACSHRTKVREHTCILQRGVVTRVEERPLELDIESCVSGRGMLMTPVKWTELLLHGELYKQKEFHFHSQTILTPIHACDWCSLWLSSILDMAFWFPSFFGNTILLAILPAPVSKVQILISLSSGTSSVFCHF